MADFDYKRPPHDGLEGIMLPEQTRHLLGHRSVEHELLETYRSGRLPNAFLLSGPAGIGKATLAFRFIRFVLNNPDPGDPRLADCDSLAISERSGGSEADKLAKGIHPNVKHLTRPYDERAKRYRTEISIDTVRQLIPFLGTSAAEGDWRFVVIDPVDDLNRNASNALLKNLEEPPQHTIFFLISHSPGRVLPTIRSRAALLRLSHLSNADMHSVLVELADQHGEGMPRDQLDIIIELAEGSPRRALELIEHDGLALHRDLVEGLSVNKPALFQSIAERCSDPRSRNLEQFVALYCGFLSRRVRGQSEPGVKRELQWNVPLVRWSELWEKAESSLRDVEIYNLDRRQFVLNLLESSSEALHG